MWACPHERPSAPLRMAYEVEGDASCTSRSPRKTRWRLADALPSSTASSRFTRSTVGKTGSIFTTANRSSSLKRFPRTCSKSVQFTRTERIRRNAAGALVAAVGEIAEETVDAVTGAAMGVDAVAAADVVAEARNAKSGRAPTIAKQLLSKHPVKGKLVASARAPNANQHRAVRVADATAAAGRKAAVVATVVRAAAVRAAVDPVAVDPVAAGAEANARQSEAAAKNVRRDRIRTR